MIVRSFLQWSQSATADERAEAIGALASIYLAGEMSPQDKRDAVAAMMMALEDTSPKVRKALALHLAGSELAPRVIISALAHDLPEIARLVLANSPVLSDAELVDAAAVADPITQQAIASRPYVSLQVSAALAEVGDEKALIALVDNGGADIGVAHLMRMVERYGASPGLRESLLSRSDLPPKVHAALALAASDHLSGFVATSGWLGGERAERLNRDCQDMTIVAIAAAADASDVLDVVEIFRRRKGITPQFLLRAVLSRQDRLFAAALASLADVSFERAYGVVSGRHAAGLKALFRKAGLPASLDPAFQSALSALYEHKNAHEPDAGVHLSSRLIQSVLVTCAAAQTPELLRLIPVLSRYQVEAMRAEARDHVAELLQQPEAVDIRETLCITADQSVFTDRRAA